MSEPRTDSTPATTKGSNVMLIGLILFSVTLAAVAQLTLKHGMNLVNDELSPDVFSLNGGSLRVVAQQPYVWSGLFLFVVAKTAKAATPGPRRPAMTVTPAR